MQACSNLCSNCRLWSPAATNVTSKPVLHRSRGTFPLPCTENTRGCLSSRDPPPPGSGDVGRPSWLGENLLMPCCNIFSRQHRTRHSSVVQPLWCWSWWPASPPSGLYPFINASLGWSWFWMILVDKGLNVSFSKVKYHDIAPRVGLKFELVATTCQLSTSTVLAFRPLYSKI